MWAQGSTQKGRKRSTDSAGRRGLSLSHGPTGSRVPLFPACRRRRHFCPLCPKGAQVGAGGARRALEDGSRSACPDPVPLRPPAGGRGREPRVGTGPEQRLVSKPQPSEFGADERPFYGRKNGPRAGSREDSAWRCAARMARSPEGSAHPTQEGDPEPKHLPARRRPQGLGLHLREPEHGFPSPWPDGWSAGGAPRSS